MKRKLEFVADRGEHLDMDQLKKAIDQARQVGFHGSVQPKVQLVSDRASGWIRTVSFEDWVS